MEVYALIYDREVVGIFSNNDEFKQKSFHFILDMLMQSNLFVNKKECGLAIKNDLKALYSTLNYSFSYNGHEFSKMTRELDKIEYISIPKQYSVNVKFIVYKESELNKPLTMVGVSDLL